MGNVASCRTMSFYVNIFPYLFSGAKQSIVLGNMMEREASGMQVHYVKSLIGKHIKGVYKCKEQLLLINLQADRSSNIYYLYFG